MEIKQDFSVEKSSQERMCKKAQEVHKAGGSDPGMHPDPIYLSSVQADSNTGGNQHKTSPSKIFYEWKKMETHFSSWKILCKIQIMENLDSIKTVKLTMAKKLYTIKLVVLGSLEVDSKMRMKV